MLNIHILVGEVILLAIVAHERVVEHQDVVTLVEIGIDRKVEAMEQRGIDAQIVLHALFGTRLFVGHEHGDVGGLPGALVPSGIESTDIAVGKEVLEKVTARGVETGEHTR